MPIRICFLAGALLYATMAVACPCPAPTAFLNTARQTDAVVVGRIIRHSSAWESWLFRQPDRWLEVEVQEVWKSTIHITRIIVWPPSQPSCGPDLRTFTPGSTWVLALHKNVGTSASRSFFGEDYTLPACGESRLAVRGKQARSLTRSVEAIPMLLPDLKAEFAGQAGPQPWITNGMALVLRFFIGSTALLIAASFARGGEIRLRN